MAAKNHLKLVVNNVPRKPRKPKVTHQELIAKINQAAGTYLDREQIVLQNLKDMGF